MAHGQIPNMDGGIKFQVNCYVIHCDVTLSPFKPLAIFCMILVPGELFSFFRTKEANTQTPERILTPTTKQMPPAMPIWVMDKMAEDALKKGKGRGRGRGIRSSSANSPSPARGDVRGSEFPMRGVLQRNTAARLNLKRQGSVRGRGKSKAKVFIRGSVASPARSPSARVTRSSLADAQQEPLDTEAKAERNRAIHENNKRKQWVERDNTPFTSSSSSNSPDLEQKADAIEIKITPPTPRKGSAGDGDAIDESLDSTIVADTSLDTAAKDPKDSTEDQPDQQPDPDQPDKQQDSDEISPLMSVEMSGGSGSLSVSSLKASPNSSGETARANALLEAKGAEYTAILENIMETFPSIIPEDTAQMIEDEINKEKIGDSDKDKDGNSDESQSNNPKQD